MRWQGRRGSRNIEDRRAAGGGAVRLGGAGGLGLIAIVVVGYFLGVDLTPLLDGTQLQPQAQQSAPLTEADRRAGQFVSVTLADTEAVWSDIFRREVGQPYRPVTLVLYKGVTRSACGGASGVTGPFYCPGDKKVYLDTAFFTTLSRRLGAGGDFAAAYVVAHEVAHHVQDEMGVFDIAADLRRRLPADKANAVQVRIELQADCLSGVWARNAQDKLGTLEPGDIDEALNAASRIGDDTLQKSAGRVPMPDSFTHGTSAQRVGWFKRGYQAGKMAACDTFAAMPL